MKRRTLGKSRIPSLFVGWFVFNIAWHGPQGLEHIIKAFTTDVCSRSRVLKMPYFPVYDFAIQKNTNIS